MACKIGGVGEEFSELLDKAGVDTVNELKTRASSNLQAKRAEVNAAKKLSKRTPVLKDVEAWVAEARTPSPAVLSASNTKRVPQEENPIWLSVSKTSSRTFHLT